MEMTCYNKMVLMQLITSIGMIFLLNTRVE